MSLFEPLFDALNRAAVRYVAVGGFETLTGLGFRPRAPVEPLAFADARVRQQWIEEKGMRVFALWNPANPMLEVDLFAEHPIDFEGLWRRAVLVKLTQAIVRIAQFLTSSI